jgi:hypothetical protein
MCVAWFNDVTSPREAHMMFFLSAVKAVLISGTSHFEALISYFNYFVRLKLAANMGASFSS